MRFPAVRIQRRSSFSRRAGPNGSSARRSLSRSPSIMDCAPKRRARRPRSSGWRKVLASRIARCAGAAKSRSPVLQEAARIARYRLLADTALRAGYAHILTAHTLDDQAETILFRLARGSGLVGLAGMAHASPLPVGGQGALFLVRPLLGLPKARLLATLAAARIGYSEDPSNHDPRFTRARLRGLMPELAREGLDARGLARLAARLRRADAAIEFAVEAARAALAPGPWRRARPGHVRDGAIRRFAGGGRAASSRPRRRACRRRRPGRTRQARSALRGAPGGPLPAAPDAGRSLDHA